MTRATSALILLLLISGHAHSQLTAQQRAVQDLLYRQEAKAIRLQGAGVAFEQNRCGFLTSCGQAGASKATLACGGSPESDTDCLNLATPGSLCFNTTCSTIRANTQTPYVKFNNFTVTNGDGTLTSADPRVTEDLCQCTQVMRVAEAGTTFDGSQFQGFLSGVQCAFPGIDQAQIVLPNGATKCAVPFDWLERPWAAQVPIPKTVIIFMDNSMSMLASVRPVIDGIASTQTSRLEAIKLAAIRMAKILRGGDVLAVILANGTLLVPLTLVPYGDTKTAKAAREAQLADIVNKISGVVPAPEVATLDVYQRLRQGDTFIETARQSVSLPADLPKACRQEVVIVLSDHAHLLEAEARNDNPPLDGREVILIRVGEYAGADEVDKALQAVSCSRGGLTFSVTDATDPTANVEPVYQFLATRTPANVTLTTSVYVDVNLGKPVFTFVRQVPSNFRILRSVIGVDVIVDDLLKAAGGSEAVVAQEITTRQQASLVCLPSRNVTTLEALRKERGGYTCTPAYPPSFANDGICRGLVYGPPVNPPRLKQGSQTTLNCQTGTAVPLPAPAEAPRPVPAGTTRGPVLDPLTGAGVATAPPAGSDDAGNFPVGIVIGTAVGVVAVILVIVGVVWYCRRRRRRRRSEAPLARGQAMRQPPDPTGLQFSSSFLGGKV